MLLSVLLKPWINIINDDCEIYDLNNDSRTIKTGDLFLAYAGSQNDGRIFIQQALDAKASAILYEQENFPKNCFIPNKINCIPISGLTNILADLAQRFYTQNIDNGTNVEPIIIGITGTNGKTTIALQLAQAYELLGETATYIGTLGYGNIGNLSISNNTTPDTLMLQKLLANYRQQNIKYVCMEVSSHALQQKRVENIAFQHAIFTNLTQDHLDYHKTMQNYAQAKAMLFKKDSLKYAILNYDDDYFNFIKQQISPQCKIITYGLQENADIYIQEWQCNNQIMHVVINTPWGMYNTKLNVLGKFNLYNIMAIFTNLVVSGYEPAKVIEVLSRLKAAKGRMEIVKQQPLVIVDYAHTPDALENILLTLKQLQMSRILLVFGCGGERDHGKRPIMGKIAEQYADIVILTSDNPRHEDPNQIILDIISGMCNTKKELHKIVNRKQAIIMALTCAKQNDIVIIAGKGHETYQQIGDEYLPFSDQKIVEEITW